MSFFHWTKKHIACQRRAVKECSRHGFSVVKRDHFVLYFGQGDECVNGFSFNTLHGLVFFSTIMSTVASVF